MLNCLHSLTKVHRRGCGLTEPQSPVQDSFAWPLTPCDAAGSSYIKKQEPKLSLSLGWAGSCGVCDTLGDFPRATSLQLQLEVPDLLRFCPAAFLLLLAPGPNCGARAYLIAARQQPPKPATASPATRIMNTEMYQTPMEVAVYQLHNFSISFFSSLLGGDVVSVKLDNR